MVKTESLLVCVVMVVLSLVLRTSHVPLLLPWARATCPFRCAPPLSQYRRPARRSRARSPLNGRPIVTKPMGDRSGAIVLQGPGAGPQAPISPSEHRATDQQHG